MTAGAAGSVRPLPLHRFGGEPFSFAMGDFDSIGPLSKADFPHRHTFYEIVHVVSGTGWHVVDLVAHPLAPPHLHVIYPGQVHFWQRTSGLEGTVILFTEAFLSAHPSDRARLQSLAGQPFPSAGFAGLFADMQSEYAARAPGFSAVLQSYLHILVLRLTRVAAVPVHSADRSTVLARDFSLLLSGSDGHRLTVRECASRLGVSQTYLNEVVRAVAGHTPAQMIRHVQVLEAQRLLASTALSVAQVAREVGFPDPAYFCRFFRRETGLSPGQFRRTSNGNHHSSRTDSIDRGN